MSDCIIVPVALAILAGECSALLWPPALVGAAWLAVKERGARRTLLPLAAGCLLCAAVLWGVPKWARRSGLRLRDWVTTCPACLLALLFAVLLLVASWYLIRRADRRWKKMAGPDRGSPVPLGGGGVGDHGHRRYRPARDGGRVAGAEGGHAEAHLDGDDV